MDEFTARRNKLLSNLRNESITVLPSANLQIRNGDAEYPFRQNSDFFYLTGYNEPDAVLVLSKDNKANVKYILFNLARDPAAETWTGKRIGQDGAKQLYHCDEAYDITSIDEVMPKLFLNHQVVYYPLAADKKFDLKILNWLNQAKHALNKKIRSSQAISFVPDTIIDVLPLLHEQRLFKSAQEIEYMRKAAEVSANAHLKLLQICRPGIMEYQLQSVFADYCLQAGCRGLAYNSIVAGGNNSCTLHYVENDQPLKDGDLVLVDAGAEYNYYAADITRTFPVSGKFSAEQKQIYNIVLDAQLAGIAEVKPGNNINKVQNVIIEKIVAGLVKLDILKGDVGQLIKNREYTKFYMHSSGHWLGLDVHDVGKYLIDNEYRAFEPGMVLTVEPGIYIDKDSAGVAQKWLGIGVRIEDDILVTPDGNEVLSKAAPKTVEEIERARI